MSNRERGTVTVEIDERSYTLVMDFNALCELEEVLSTPGKERTIPEIIVQIQKGGVRFTRAFIWAALREHHPEVTIKEAGALVTKAGGPLGLAQQMQALTGSMLPDSADLAELGLDDKRPPPAQPAKKAGAGATSTSRRVVSG